MRSTSTRVVVFLAAVVAALALFVVLRNNDGDDDFKVIEPAATATEQAQTDQAPGAGAPPEIVIRNGEPVGGVAEYELARGERIRFVVSSDVDDEVHLHGYDVSKPVKAGGEASFDVPATIEGIFEVELEESGVPIAEITVSP